MRAYISTSYSKRNLIDSELDCIANTLNKFGIDPFLFIDRCHFDSSQEREMMQQVMTVIHECDMLIAETSEKGIGIGVEVGYAMANNKPVIYMRRKDAVHSTTVSGISDFHIIYESIKDLEAQLFDTLEKILRNRMLEPASIQVFD